MSISVSVRRSERSSSALSPPPLAQLVFLRFLADEEGLAAELEVADVERQHDLGRVGARRQRGRALVRTQPVL